MGRAWDPDFLREREADGCVGAMSYYTAARIRSAGETDEGGRGLYLVDQIATRWAPGPPGMAKRSGSS